MDRPNEVGGVRVLLVDDEETVAETLSAVLTRAGYTVTVATSAPDAHAAVGGAAFDVVLADLRLNQLDDGLTILRLAKRLDPDVVAILLTGYASTQSAIDALELGASAYLTKPCNLDQLKLTIYRGLDVRRQMRRIREQARAAEDERNFLRLLLDHAPVGIVVTEGADDRVTLINAAHLAMTDLQPEDVLGRPLGESFPEGYESARRPLARARWSGRPQPPVERVIPLASGRRLHVESTYAPLPAPEGELPAVMAVSLDVTELHASREAAARAQGELEAVVEQISDGFFALDRDWRFTFINQRAIEVSAAYGLPATREELLGRVIWDVFPRAVGSPLYDHYQRAMNDGVPLAMELPPNELGMSLVVRIYPSDRGLSVFYQDLAVVPQPVDRPYPTHATGD